MTNKNIDLEVVKVEYNIDLTKEDRNSCIIPDKLFEKISKDKRKCIVLTGRAGCGKSTSIDRLKKKLINNNFRVVDTSDYSVGWAKHLKPSSDVFIMDYSLYFHLKKNKGIYKYRKDKLGLLNNKFGSILLVSYLHKIEDIKQVNDDLLDIYDDVCWIVMDTEIIW